jgi:hypothetical protein
MTAKEKNEKESKKKFARFGDSDLSFLTIKKKGKTSPKEEAKKKKAAQ